RPAGEGEQPDRAAVGARPDAPGHLVAVDVRQADVEKHDLRPKVLHRAQRFACAVDRLDLVAVELEDETQTFGGVAIVVDDEHAARRAGGRRFWNLVYLGASRRERQ